MDNYSAPDRPLVLVVDNDRDNLLFASYIIESMGLKYSVLDDGEKCLDLVYDLLPDIILLDIVMPKISGLEIARTIRQDKNIAHTPLVAVTGLTQAKYKTELVNAGFDDYLCKPYLIEELESRIHERLWCRLNNSHSTKVFDVLN